MSIVPYQYGQTAILAVNQVNQHPHSDVIKRLENLSNLINNFLCDSNIYIESKIYLTAVNERVIDFKLFINDINNPISEEEIQHQLGSFYQQFSYFTSDYFVETSKAMRSAEDYLARNMLRNNTCMEIIPYAPPAFSAELISQNPPQIQGLNEQLVAAAQAVLRPLREFHQQQVETLRRECEETVNNTRQNCEERIRGIRERYLSIISNIRAQSAGRENALADQLDAANDRIVELNAGVQNLNSQIENLNHQSDDLNTQLDNASRNMIDLRNQVDGLSRRLLSSINAQSETYRIVQTLELAVEELLVEGESKDQEIVTLKGRVVELSGQLTEREAIIDTREQEIATLKGRVAELSGQLTGRDVIIGECNQAITNLDAQRAAVVIERNDLNGQLAQRNGIILNRDENIAGLQAAIVETQAQHAAETAQLTARIDRRNARIAQRNQVIAGLREDNAALTAAKADLERQLSASIPRVLTAEANLKTIENVADRLIRLLDIELSLGNRYKDTVHAGKRLFTINLSPDQTRDALNYNRAINNQLTRLKALKEEIKEIEILRTADIHDAARNGNLVEMNIKIHAFVERSNLMTTTIRELWSNRRMSDLIELAQGKLGYYIPDWTRLNALRGREEEGYLAKGIALGDEIHQKEGKGYIFNPETFHKGLHYGELLYKTFDELINLRSMINTLSVQNTSITAPAAQ